MRFVDRRRELEQLSALIARAEGGLAALWGRRRVGKTRLLLEWCRRHGGCYTVADLSAETVQRRYVAQALAERFAGFGEVEYPDWRALLRALAREAARRGDRGPIVFDEFPYLAEASPSLPSVMQAWLDHDAREATLVVAVCGSAQHMMQGLVLDAGAPLFGRAVAALCVAPMSVAALAAALGFKEAVDAVRAFSVWGGIPRYWELAEPYGKELDRAVADLVLDPLGALHQEPDRLLTEERPPAASLRPLLDAIGTGAHRLSEIASRLGQPATSLSRGLARLQELGLVSREQPFATSERTSKRSLYRISDPFFRLWFRMIAPNRGWLVAAQREGRLALWARHGPALLAETWEALCRQSVPGLARPGGPLAHLGPLGPAGRFWHGTGPEWDVVARSLDGAVTLLGEVKWHKGQADAGLVERALRELEAKGKPTAIGEAGSSVVHVVFVPSRPPRWSRRRERLVVVDAEDVVVALREEPGPV